MRSDSLSDYAAILRRRAFSIVLTAMIVGGSVLSVGLRLPRTYTASLLIEVESRPNTPLSGLPTLVQSALGGADPTMLQTLASRLTSTTLLEAARRDLTDVEPTGAKRLPPLPTLVKSVHASVEPGSSLLRVSVDLRESEGGARNAALFANQLVETFRRQLADEDRNDRQRDATVQLELIQKKRRELALLLDATREDLLGFARREGSPTLWSAELTQGFERLDAMAQERRIAESRLRLAEIEQEMSNAALDSEPEMTVTAKSDGTPAMRTRVEQDLLATKAESARRSGEGLAEESPERRGLTAAEMYLTERLNSTPERETTTTLGLNPRRDWLLEAQHASSVSLAAFGSELTALDALIKESNAALRSRSARIPEGEVRLAILQRQAESLARLYDELLSRQSEVELALGQAVSRVQVDGRKVGGISVVDPARPEYRPVRPRPTYLLAAGAALGLLSGLAVGLGLEWTDAKRVGSNNARKGSAVDRGSDKSLDTSGA
jgi:hypothetical protein